MRLVGAPVFAEIGPKVTGIRLFNPVQVGMPGSETVGGSSQAAPILPGDIKATLFAIRLLVVPPF